MGATRPPGLPKDQLVLVGGTAARSVAPLENYKPYPVDWRFLPEELLLLKDFVRFNLSNLSNTIAGQPALSRLWAASLGKRTISSITRAAILFVHVPKAGGTSISQCLYGRNLPHYSAAFYRTVYPSTASLPSFAVIRHPVERFLSAYAFLLGGGTSVVACDRHDRSRIGDLSSIDAVVDALYARQASLSSQPAGFQRQSDYISSQDGSIIVDRLFSLDSTRGFSPELAHWLGRPSLPHINVTDSQSFAVSEASRRKIKDIYAADVALYHRLLVNGGHLEIRAPPAKNCLPQGSRSMDAIGLSA